MQLSKIKHETLIGKQYHFPSGPQKELSPYLPPSRINCERLIQYMDFINQGYQNSSDPMAYHAAESFLQNPYPYKPSPDQTLAHLNQFPTFTVIHCYQSRHWDLHPLSTSITQKAAHPRDALERLHLGYLVQPQDYRRIFPHSNPRDIPVVVHAGRLPNKAVIWDYDKFEAYYQIQQLSQAPSTAILPINIHGNPNLS